jgi:hypothetical protein
MLRHNRGKVRMKTLKPLPALSAFSKEELLLLLAELQIDRGNQKMQRAARGLPHTPT